MFKRFTDLIYLQGHKSAIFKEKINFEVSKDFSFLKLIFMSSLAENSDLRATMALMYLFILMITILVFF